MKTTITTKSKMIIEISSIFKGNKEWKSGAGNFNNSLVFIYFDSKKLSFDFWGSKMNPEITKDNENIFAFYCFLSDAMIAKEDYDSFLSNFGYEDSIEDKTPRRIYKACLKALEKFQRVFVGIDLYDLVNELQEEYDL